MTHLAHWQRRPRPRRFTLASRFCLLEPLELARHGDHLFAAAVAPGAEERFRET